MVKIQCFDYNFDKKPFTSLLLKDAKNLMGAHFWIFPFFAIYSTKTHQNCDFCHFKNPLPSNFLHSWVVSLCKFSIKSVKYSRTSRDLKSFWMTFWSKHCIFSQFFAPLADLQMSIKSVPLRVKRVSEHFLKPGRIDLENMLK